MMIQDISPSVFYNQYTPEEPLPDSAVMIFQKDSLLAAYDENSKAILFPARREFAREARLIYAFRIDGRSFFLAPEAREAPAGYGFIPLKKLRDMPLSSNVFLFAAYSAYHLWSWYAECRFCGRCGAVLAQDRDERAMYCPCCQNKKYPRINPAVIVGVTRGDTLLLTKYRAGFAHNALVAGFAEFGETLEQTVRREVMEEVGLRVKNIRYYKSQPWGTAADILAGFFCQADGDPAIRMDRNELKYAQWVRRQDIILQPGDYSLTNEMMRLFKEGRLEKYYESLPMPF